MRLVTISTLAAAAAALPTDVVRTLPSAWDFSIASLRGPGCPDASAAPSTYKTRLTYGQNTVDGSEIYYWHIAYPWLRVSLKDGQEDTWCETEVQYNEYVKLGEKPLASDYRLRLHKNGTRLISTYALDAGVKATFTAEYDVGDDDVRSPTI